MSEVVLSLFASGMVVTLAVAITAIFIARAKAPPETNEELANKVRKIEIELEDVADALERWGKRTSVRESRARAKADDLVVPQGEPLTGARTGIIRQHVRT